MRRLWLLAFLLIGCKGGTATKTETDAGPAALTVELATAKQQDIEDTLPVDGTLTLPEGATSRVAPSVAGKLVDVLVKEGDRVVAGQLLARVDTRALLAQSQSAVAGAASAAASASQSDLALKAAQADQVAAVQTARLALDVAAAEGKSSVEQASIELQKLKAGARPQEVAQAQLAVDQARIARDKARTDADRDARLLQEGLVSGSQADASKASYQTAQSALRSAQSALDLVKAGNRTEDIQASELRLASTKELAAKKIDQAKAGLRQARSGQLSVAAKAKEAAAAHLSANQKSSDAAAAAAAVGTAEVRSPISGYVSRRFLNKGDISDPANPVFSVAATKPSADFVGSLSPDEASKVRVGMRAAVGSATGTVSSVGEADSATGLVPIRIHISTAARAGGFVTAQVVTAVLRGIVVVPKVAIVSREGKDVVFVAQDGVAHLTEVKLGPESNGLVAIRQGLKTGADVVVSGNHELSDGSKIEAEKGK